MNFNKIQIQQFIPSYQKDFDQAIKDKSILIL